MADKKAKQSKHMKDVAFSLEVCNAIRHHIGERMALDSKRVIAFEDRDAAIEEKNEIDDHESDAYFEACRRHSDAIAAIDSLNARIKWHRNQVDEMVEKADSPQLDFMYEPPVEPAKKDPRQMKIGDGLGEGEKKADTRPVGRPGPAKPAAPSPEMGDGVDEHLKTSVNELDLREDIKGKLIKHQFNTVHQLVAQMACQGESEADALMSVVEDSMTLAECKAVCKAVKTFRVKHRDAMLKKDRGE